MTSAKNVIFVGGPGSGKSNYLFRSWLAIERETGKLVKDGLPDDLAYLHDGASVLLSGRFAPHTSRDTHHISRVPVSGRDSAQPAGELVVPDASGELWLNVYQKREWPTAWDGLVTPTLGLVLFYRARSPHNVLPLDWIACEKLHAGKLRPAPTKTPTQVMLVDWLQVIRSLVDSKVSRSYVPKLSIVVAAWDELTASSGQTPADYLEQEAPLFAHFIQAHGHRFDTRIFGLSIFGGDPQNDEEFRLKLEASDPANLGYSVSVTEAGTTRAPDVLHPLYWALGLGE